MNTWTEGGKGRRQCPKCKLYIPARATLCVCEGGGTAEKKEPTTFETGGKGRKQCPGCKQYVGAKSGTCPGCGHEFERKEKPAPPPEAVAAPASSSSAAPVAAVPVRHRGLDARTKVIEVPAGPEYGKCPAGPLKTLVEPEIALWATEIREWGLRRNIFFTARAIKYYVRETWDYNSDEYKLVCGYWEYPDRRRPIFHPGVLDALNLDAAMEEAEDEEEAA